MEIPGYEITRCIGQGGMATAYLARQTSLDRQVVLKILDTSTNDTPQIVERFLNEGRLVAALNHPHIITIYDINMSMNDVFIAMEYVEGGDLKERLQAQSFAPSEAIDIIRKIASGLGAAHEKGIVHRDVKPGNILFRKDGTPLLSDFGIAKDLTIDGDLTATGMFVGSPNYMSPEQAEAGPIDGRTDIYALGVIFFEMITGQKPFNSESIVDIILAHKKAPVPTLPGGLEGYQEFINLTMAKDREARFRDAPSMVHYLDQLPAKLITQAVSNAPDFDITGAVDIPARQPPTRLSVEQKKKVDRKSLLLALLLIVGVANLVLAYFGREMSRPQISPHHSALTMPSSVLQPETRQALSPPDDAAELPNTQEVAAAMRWLAQHSLNEYRLVSPPKDNAFYYYSRLLQLNPEDKEAQAGMRQIAASYSVLADRAIADGDNVKARSFISMGLQIDPNNPALKSLNQLALPERSGLFSTISRTLSQTIGSWF